MFPSVIVSIKLTYRLRNIIFVIKIKINFRKVKQAKQLIQLANIISLPTINP